MQLELVISLMLPSIVLDPLITQTTLEWVRSHSLTTSMEHQDTRYTTRRTVNFGYSYFKMMEGDKSFTPIPSPLVQCLSHAIRKLCSITPIAYQNAEAYTNCIVSWYGPGYQLEPHIDVDVADGQGFGFGDEIIGIVLQSDPKGKFFLQKADSLPQYDAINAHLIAEQNGTVFALKGTHRRAPWYHGVSPVQSERISLTFRTVIA